MLFIPHDSSVIERVFKFVEQFDESGQYPKILENEALQILECVLDLGIYSLLEHILPLVAQNLKDIPENVIYKIPIYIIPKLVEEIPLARLNPDLVIKYFGYEVLSSKVQIIYHTLNLLNPFFDIYDYNETNPLAKLANNLIRVSPRFSQSDFVRNNCTIIESKNYDFYINFPNLKVLYLHSVDVGDSIEPFLNPSIIKLSIVKCHLKPLHVEQLIKYIPNSKVEFISLRDNRIGAKGCSILTEFIKNQGLFNLRYLDIGLNSIGGTGIHHMIEVICKSPLKAIAFDGNFFAPCANEISHIPLVICPYISIRALHWDDATVSNIRLAMQEPYTRWWDLSAQVIHKNSDPDLSGKMAEQLFTKMASEIEHLIFANHHLTNMNLSCFMEMKLKTLVLANSGLDYPSLQKVTDIVMKLEYFDISYNKMTFTSPSFLIQCAESKTLKFLSLTNNTIPDTFGEMFFINLSQSQSQIKTLRISECGLSKRSTYGLITLLSAGNMAFDELDVSVNQMFHNTKDEIVATGQTKVTKFMIGGNLTDNHSKHLVEAIKACKDVQYLDADYINFNLVREISEFLPNLFTLRTSYVKIQDINVVIDVLRKTKTRVLYAQNSFKTKTFSLLMQSWAEVPMLLEIHVESRLKDNMSKQFNIVFEDLK